MSDRSYDDILEQSWDDIPDPVLLPAGDWLLAGRNVAIMEPRNPDDNARALFFYVPVEPVSVDQELLAELPDDYDLSVNQITYQIWLDGPRAWAQVRKHLERHGVTTEGRTLKESFKAFAGAEVIATLDEREYQTKDGENRIENVATRFAPVEG